MSQRTTELLAEILQLPAEERALLIEELLSTFDLQPGEADPVDDDEFLAELDRRAAELRSDPTAGVSWDEVKNRR